MRETSALLVDKDDTTSAPTGIGDFGAIFQDDGRVRFRLWAPANQHVNLAIEGRQLLPMRRLEGGWFEVTTACDANTAYRYQIDDDLLVADPACRAVRDDAFGSSLVYDTNAYRWRVQNWKGRPWQEAVFYELHVGAFGGFTGVIEALPRLARLGVTAIEIMPISAFPGHRNWGYDGVLPYAPSPAYGSPDELKALVDAAHELGLMVFLDVVYNHFGPEGNFLGEYAPFFFRSDLHSPWGRAIDFGRDEVRRFYTENGLYWLEEFRFDGLRFDAVHAITHPDWLDETTAEFRKRLPKDRFVHFVLENDDNISSHLREGYFAAQWNDDVHHVLHVLLTGETNSYYIDYAESPACKLARALSEGFIYQGAPSVNRGGDPRGTPSKDLRPDCFVFFLQNHDQVGNRLWGEHLTELTEPTALEAAIALQILAPNIPLIFMGEEVASKSPFLYFCEMSEHLARSIREGRKREFKLEADEIPDAAAIETFERSIPRPDLQWGERRFRYYQRLLALRSERITTHITGAQSLGAHAISDKAVIARWRLGNGAILTIFINLGANSTFCSPQSDPLLFQSVDGVYEDLKQGTLAPMATVVLLKERQG